MANIENELFGGTVEENIAADKNKGGFSKIEASCVNLFKITMAKQVDSAKSGAKDFVIELENEAGAKAYWKAGWHIGADGSNVDSKGKEKWQSVELRKRNYLITGNQSLPTLEEAMIKEADWSTGKPVEVTVKRLIAKALIGKFVNAQVIRVRQNKQVKGPVVDGKQTYVDSAEEQFVNQVKSFFDGSTKQSPAEKAGNVEASIINDDIEYCAKNPIVDKYKTVAGTPAAGGTTTQAGGFGGNPAESSGFAQPQTGFGQPQ